MARLATDCHVGHVVRRGSAMCSRCGSYRDSRVDGVLFSSSFSSHHLSVRARSPFFRYRVLNI